ncbi:MAG: MotA/TolQ/ExbB proton channel family protein [Wenzhouxiangellaceae bacterium]|nr:MotA/TolQ/ExbB proton channel family protein [Wenzhouxiangellaceae bacterium]
MKKTKKPTAMISSTVTVKAAFWLVAACLAMPGYGHAQETLDELLREVERAATEEARIDQQRLQEFRQQRERQRQLLQQARAELSAEEQRSDRLNTAFDNNERELVELSTTLDERMGNLGELFGVVRQIAGDMRSALDDSMVSAQFPGRSEFYANLAERSDTQLPSVDELRTMWTGMVREIAESGKVVEFNADLVNADGQVEENREVVRVGVFNAVSGGKFLQWDSDQSMLLELPRQPAGRFQDMARDLQQSEPGTVQEMAVDFTRGDILAQVVRAPTYRERLRQGGTVGMIIIVIGIIGVLFALWKGVMLFIRGNAIKRQIKRESADKGNALGRVLSVYEENPDADVETLELKLDEAILRETAPLEAGLPLIKVLYVVAPLLGLLGTVVGMIQTFQQITLFGTGDPRMMASGISMALITTVLGLCVAIPLTVIHSMLQSRSRELIQVLEEQAAGIIARTAEERHGSAV